MTVKRYIYIYICLVANNWIDINKHKNNKYKKKQMSAIANISKSILINLKKIIYNDKILILINNITDIRFGSKVLLLNQLLGK